MTRFLITLSEGVNTVLYALKNQIGGEIFIPKMPSCKIIDICKALNPSRKIKIVGVRPGEKLHEELISKNDSHYTFQTKNYYIIINESNNSDKIIKFHKRNYHAKNVANNFSYNSKENKYLNLKEIKKIF